MECIDTSLAPGLERTRAKKRAKGKHHTENITLRLLHYIGRLRTVGTSNGGTTARAAHSAEVVFAGCVLVALFVSAAALRTGCGLLNDSTGRSLHRADMEMVTEGDAWRRVCSSRTYKLTCHWPLSQQAPMVTRKEVMRTEVIEGMFVGMLLILCWSLVGLLVDGRKNQDCCWPEEVLYTACSHKNTFVISTDTRTLYDNMAFVITECCCADIRCMYSFTAHGVDSLLHQKPVSF